MNTITSNAPLNSQQFTCKLERLNAFLQTEMNGDEVFLKYNGKKIWPMDQKFANNKSGGNVLDIPINIELDNWIEIELWEYNYVLSNRCLGSFKLYADKRGGPYVADLIANKTKLVKYSLIWSIESIMKRSFATIL